MAVFDPARYFAEHPDWDDDDADLREPWPYEAADPALLRLPYAEYLQTEHWLARRHRALLRAGGVCQCCHAEERLLDVHHLTYRRLGCEREKDLMVLCRDCHSAVHATGLPLPGRLTTYVEILRAQLRYLFVAERRSA